MPRPLLFWAPPNLTWTSGQPQSPVPTLPAHGHIWTLSAAPVPPGASTAYTYVCAGDRGSALYHTHSMGSEGMPIFTQGSVTTQRSHRLEVVTTDLRSSDSILLFQFVPGSLCCRKNESAYVLCPGSTDASTVLVVKRSQATVFTTLKKG